MKTTSKLLVQTMGVRLTVFVMAVVLMASCSTVKNTAAKKPLNAATATAQKAGENLCERMVTYYFEKVIITNEDGNEKEDNRAGTMTFNPGDGKMTMRAVERDREEVTKVNLVSCTLSAGMQSGEAFYTITESDVPKNGSTSTKKTYVSITAVKGAVHFSILSESKAGGMKATAMRWEVVN